MRLTALLVAASVALTVYITPFVVYLAITALSAVVSVRRRREFGGGVRFLFVIPGHDEEGGIAETVTSCRAVSYDPALFSTVVIADNCTDRTATVAREAGAVVVERFDPVRRSKGHALEHFFTDAPEAQPGAEFDAFVVVDADTVVDRDLLRAFAGAMSAGWDWVQGYYSVRNPDASWRTRLLTFAFSLQNGVLPLGQEGLGLSVGLKGNGMCFSQRGLSRFPWKAYGLVEDAEFSWMLRVAGERVHFLPDARVYGEMVSRGGDAAASQRRRWEAGRKELRRRFYLPVVRSGALSLPAKAVALVELAMPPLTVLFMGLIAASAISLVPPLTPWAQRLAPVHGALAVGLTTYVLSPFPVLGLPLRYLSGLAAVPYYIVWKVVVAAGRAPTAWVRTRREGVGRGGPG